MTAVVEPSTSVMVWCDPACGWSQIGVTWLRRAAIARRLVVELQPYSLFLRDARGGGGRSPNGRRVASLRALRVLAHLTRAEPTRALPFWDAVVAQDGAHPFADIAGALRDIGEDDALAALADDPRLDRSIEVDMATLDELLGAPAVLPTLVIDGEVAFTGPLLRAAPDVDVAAELWDAIALLAEVPGFYELSRPRPAHPAIAGLPAVAEPPVRRRGSRASRSEHQPTRSVVGVVEAGDDPLPRLRHHRMDRGSKR